MLPGAAVFGAADDDGVAERGKVWRRGLVRPGSRTVPCRELRMGDVFRRMLIFSEVETVGKASTRAEKTHEVPLLRWWSTMNTSQHRTRPMSSGRSRP
jgi:hypothetical protein